MKIKDRSILDTSTPRHFDTAASLVIIFTRYPVPGQTKTRLIPALGEEGAAELQRRMTEHTLDSVRSLVEDGLDIHIRFTGGNLGQMEGWLGKGLTYAPQGEGDLGARMEKAFRESIQAGFRKVIIVGTDCPDLDQVHIREALALLVDNHMVLGPATDGGYYLIGMRADASERLFVAAFQGIPWGTSQVFTGTVNALAETGIDLGLLDELDDVDEPEDLIHWEKAGKPLTIASGSLTISVIIPTLNEEDHIHEILDDLAKTNDLEVIIADGGSTDGTVDICRRYDIPIVQSKPGRASQMNTGASASTGDILLFLHSDTRLPEGFVHLIRQAMSRKNVIAGAFRFSTDMDTWGMKVVEGAANWRSRNLRIVFGDQAIFVGRNAFEVVGGFPEQVIMEDYQLIRQLRKAGKILLLPDAAVTSARRWRDNGVFRTSFRNQLTMWLYLLGVNPERLARWYHGKK
jgi:rSAM/selenodomain-associated transferase 2/rSAM/selenodomain-associated transferase 1